MNDKEINYDRISVFVVTKILQYINVSNINTANTTRYLILVDSFIGYTDFVEKVKEFEKEWEGIVLVSNRMEAFDWIKKNQKVISDLFLDSDYGDVLRSILKRLDSSISIHVYEEGIGTYLNSLYKPSSFPIRFKRWVKSLLTSDEPKLGGCTRTSNIIIYNRKYYLENVKFHSFKNVSTFQNNFLTQLENKKHLFNILPDDLVSIRNKDIFLYISSWEIKMEKLDRNYDLKIFKPHPHLKSFDVNEECFDYIIPGDIPAEMLILMLINNDNHIDILSDFSTATLYFRNNKNIRFFDMYEYDGFDYKQFLDLLDNYSLQ